MTTSARIFRRAAPLTLLLGISAPGWSAPPEVKAPASSAATPIDPGTGRPAAAVVPGSAPASAAPASAPRPVRPKLTVTVDPDPTPIVEDTVDRAKVEAVFARGPQFIAASVQVQPAFENKKFLGFRILSFTRGSVFADSMGLRPGDVVIRINNERIERPEMFMRAWEIARQAPVIEARVLRDGEVVRYRWRVSP